MNPSHQPGDLQDRHIEDYHSASGVTATQVWHAGDVETESGVRVPGVQVSYQTLGTLSPAADNAILVCHALSGSAHVAGIDAGTGRPGWWDFHVGPGKAIDTDRYFVLSTNVLGGCSGTTGPSSARPNRPGEVWGSDFPVITVGDMVTLQARLADHLGIARFAAITGGSMGGMQALEWSRRFPHRVSRVVAIASCARHDALQIAFNEIGRCAVTSDPAWAGGRYGAGRVPGLAVARMVGHVTYLSRASMEEKFGRRLQADDPPPARFAVQSYLDHQGESFIARFDPNAFLLLTRALDAFDWHPPALREISDPPRYRLISFTSDWLYPPEQSASLQDEITAAGGDCTWQNLDSAYGHDSFLIENPAFAQAMRHALDG